LCALAAHAFGDHHHEALGPIAALLGSAMEHWRLWDTERRRRERLERVETLLGSLTESLDVRESSSAFPPPKTRPRRHRGRSPTRATKRGCPRSGMNAGSIRR
jgi:hypothetical protein